MSKFRRTQRLVAFPRILVCYDTCGKQKTQQTKAAPTRDHRRTAPQTTALASHAHHPSSMCSLTSTPTGARRRAFARHGARARVRVGRAVRAHVSHFRPHRTETSTKNVALNPGPQSIRGATPTEPVTAFSPCGRRSFVRWDHAL